MVADLPPPYLEQLHQLDELHILRLVQSQGPTEKCLTASAFGRQVDSDSFSPGVCRSIIPQPKTLSRPSNPAPSPSALTRKRRRRKAIMKDIQPRPPQVDEEATQAVPPRHERSPTQPQAGTSATPSEPDRPGLRNPRLAHIVGSASSTSLRASSQPSTSPSSATTNTSPPFSLPEHMAARQPLFSLFSPIPPSNFTAPPPSADRPPVSNPVESGASPYGPAPGQPGYQLRLPPGGLFGPRSTTPHSTSPSGPRPTQPLQPAAESAPKTVHPPSPSPQQEHLSLTRPSSSVQKGKRPLSDDAETTAAATKAPFRRRLTPIAEYLIDARITSGPRSLSQSSGLPWIRDPELIESASNGLLMPLELIRLLSFTTVHHRGIELDLWQTYPGHKCSTDARDRRRQIFTSVFADRDTLIEAWHNYETLAIEVNHFSALRIIEYFHHRWGQIESYGRTYGWLQMLEILHDRQEVCVAEGLTMDRLAWLDLDLPHSYIDWRPPTDVTAAGAKTQ